MWIYQSVLFLLWLNFGSTYETEIGLGLTGFGILFSFLGIIFFFDKGLLAMGNVSFLLPCSLFSSFLVYIYKCGPFYICSILFLCVCVTCQILFISGVMLTIGLKSTMQFFTKPKNYKVQLSLHIYLHLMSCIFCFTRKCIVFWQGTISFGAGFFLVLIGWAVIGMILETYGFLVLFRYRALVLIMQSYILHAGLLALK